jgi:hypothetical protein
MIRNLVLNGEPAKPAIGQINPHLTAQRPFRADRQHVADDQHPDHQHRINRGPPDLGIIGRKLRIDPAQVENSSNRANRMIVRNCLIKTE